MDCLCSGRLDCSGYSNLYVSYQLCRDSLWWWYALWIMWPHSSVCSCSSCLYSGRVLESLMVYSSISQFIRILGLHQWLDNSQSLCNPGILMILYTYGPGMISPYSNSDLCVWNILNQSLWYTLKCSKDKVESAHNYFRGLFMLKMTTNWFMLVSSFDLPRMVGLDLP